MHHRHSDQRENISWLELRRVSSRARQELTGAALAPKNAETLAELRRQHRRAQIKGIPPEVMEFPTRCPTHLDPKIFHPCLSGAPLGVAPGPGGRTNEMLGVCLDDIETSQLLFRAVEDLPRGKCRRLRAAV